MKEIKLINGGVALVDDEDFDEINQYNWSHHKEKSVVYAWRHQKNGFRQYTKIKMHRQIMNAKPGQQIDHKDRDGLNNQKPNLRFCDHAQNLMNAKKRNNCSSKYKGVSWHSQNGKWRASIGIDGKFISLGCFLTPEEAAEAYNRMATELFGDFARLNQLTGAVDRPQQQIGRAHV